MKNFNRKRDIKAGRIVIYTTKTNEPVSMPFSPKLKALFESIDYKPLHYHNVHYNRLLKAVAALSGIDENISSHVSRHTFAVMCAGAGISIEVTGKLLGHSSIKTTAIYYKITNTRIDEEMKKLQL